MLGRIQPDILFRQINRKSSLPILQTLPIRAIFPLPAIGMEPADQRCPVFLSITVGHSVVMNTALAGFWPGGSIIREAKLRSQDVALTLHALPASMISFAEKVINLSKGILGGVHGDDL